MIDLKALMKPNCCDYFFVGKITSRALRTCKNIAKIITKRLAKLGLKTGQKQGPDSGLLDLLTHDRATVHGQGTLTVRPLGCKILNPCLAM